jgi:hypothetical protein
LPRGCCVHQAVDRPRLRCSQALNVREKERLVTPNRAANAAAVNVLHELAFAEVVEVLRPFIRIQSRRAIEPESVSMEFVRT